MTAYTCHLLRCLLLAFLYSQSKVLKPVESALSVPINTSLPREIYGVLELAGIV